MDVPVTGRTGRFTVQLHAPAGDARAVVLVLDDDVDVTAVLDQGMAVYALQLPASDDQDALVADVGKVMRLARAVYPRHPFVVLGGELAARAAEAFPDRVSGVAAAPEDLARITVEPLPPEPEGERAWAGGTFRAGWSVAVDPES